MANKYVLLKVDPNTTRTLDKPEEIVGTFTITDAIWPVPMILWYDASGYEFAYTRIVDGEVLHHYRARPSDDISELTPDE